jgi:aminobenzoyl-glutamate utilization protein B
MVAGYGYGLPVHSWPVVAASGSSIGAKTLIVAAKVMAATAVDLFTDPELVARAKEEFAGTAGKMTFKTVIPEGQRAPASVH